MRAIRESIKLHYSQLDRFPDIAENFAHIFPNAKYISITRRNILRQAISATRANQTQSWESHNPERKKPRFNIFGILKYFMLIAKEIELWENFYVANDIKPLRILYEDLDQQYEKTMQEVVSFLEISGAIPPPPLKKQADVLNDIWAQRYVDLLKENRSFIRLFRFLMRCI